MKITKQQLKKIIKEELSKVLREGYVEEKVSMAQDVVNEFPELEIEITNFDEDDAAHANYESNTDIFYEPGQHYRTKFEQEYKPLTDAINFEEEMTKQSKLYGVY